jgi:methionyl-tRNA synthetase
VFHSLMWPAMLMAEGSFQLPTNVVANSFINIQFPGKEEEKMSKSRGTAVWIGEYLKEYDPDPLRYYLTLIAPENQRTAFNMDDLIRRNNDELVGTLGNFVHRTMMFATKYLESRAPRISTSSPEIAKVLALLEHMPLTVGKELDEFRFKNALGLVMELAREGNRFFDHQAPWKQRKDDPAGCGTTIAVCLRIVRSLAILGEPFLPASCSRAAALLGLGVQERSWFSANEPVDEGRQLEPATPLFRKIE